MNKFLKGLKEIDNYIYTENGAAALESTLNPLLDAFGSLGAMRNSSEKDILDTFYKSYYYDKENSLKLLFYIRDIRGGQGMRRVFRIILRSLAFKESELVVKNLENILYFGRGDDILCLLDTPIEKDVAKWVKELLCEDLESFTPSLLAKWLPSENASSPVTRAYAKKIINLLGMTPREYRKTLSSLRNKIKIVETNMSLNKWEDIEYSKLPAKASMIYTSAFYRHTPEKYIEYIKDLANGEAKVNASSLFPVDIVHKALNTYCDYKNDKDTLLLDAMWKALPDYFGENKGSGICVVDVSGSMRGIPLEVALSLGLYCADKCSGPYKNTFITFSEKPKLQEVCGDNIVEKLNHMENSDWDMNTDLEKVFELILEVATVNKLSQEELPSKLYIISDMQFDDATNHSKNKTFIESMREKFEEHGYKLPALVYWNVRASNNGMFQQTVGGENCCMVSGYSPSLFKSVIEGTNWVEETIITDSGETKITTKQVIDPINVMMTTLNDERYSRVITK